MPEPEPNDKTQTGRWFPATHWTDIMAARREGSTAASEALNRLCTDYWYPIYAYIRRRGHTETEAKDIAQSFFYHVIERNLLGAADRTKGKFRSFLLGSLNYFLSNRYEFEQAQKRGGGAILISLDDKTPEERYALEPVDQVTPEKLFDRRWALDLLQQAQQQLREEYARQGKATLYQELKPFLQEQTTSGEYAPVARSLQMTPGAVTTAVNRLRVRYGELIEAEIGRTVASSAEIAEERRYLYDILSLS